MKTQENLLEIRNLHTYFFTNKGTIKAVNGVDMEIQRGKTLGVVGESGSGKSITSFSILRLIEDPGDIVEGSIMFDGQELLDYTEDEMRSIRGNEISMIFQEPMTSLNPVLKIGEQLGEPLILHQGMDKKQAWARSIELLREVKIPEPEGVVHNYPHQLSGGMRQRVMIAMALACEPKLLIADEPTTALDVTIQAQIFNLMNDLKKKHNTAILFITHDLGAIAELADDVVVMYTGEAVEKAPVPAKPSDRLQVCTSL
jgi:peptide/nickel transport system ATP-binding protein